MDLRLIVAATPLAALLLAQNPVVHQDALFPISKAGKWGYIDRSGKVIVAPRYDQAFEFSDGLGAVREGKLWGYLDSSGQVRIPIKFEQLLAFPFCGESALVYDPRANVALLGRNGEVTPKPEWEKAVDCHGGVMAVRQKRKWGYFTAAGVQVVEAKFDAVGQFGEGAGPASVDGKWGYVDNRGRWVIEPRFDEAGRFSEGLAPVRVAHLWGYIDRSGKFAREPAYSLAYPFSRGRGRVVLWGEDKLSRTGFVDKTGKFVIEPQYPVAGDFVEDRAQVRVGDKIGFIDPEGRMAIPAKYDFAADFAGGLALVKSFSKPGESVESYVDRDGRTVWSSR